MVELASIQAAFSALKAAKELGAAALELRDFNQTAAAISQINAQLLKAQEGLFELQGAMFEAQAENHRLQEEVRQLKAAQDLREKYDRVALTPGNFAYRLKESPPDRHYVCQPCLDVRGQEVDLMRRDRGSHGVVYSCSECKTTWSSDEDTLRKKYPGLAGEAMSAADRWGRNT